MRRFFAEPGQRHGSRIELDERESHHILHVLRARVGEELTILDGQGLEHTCRIAQTSKRAVTVEITATKQHKPLPYDLTLFQAIPKGKVMDGIIQNATELGARRIVPILTERTIVEIDEDSTKVEKWRAIGIESIKQCGSPFLPRIDAPIQFAKALKQISGLPLVASLHPGAGEIHEFFGRDKRPVQIWVGPEGDFASNELEQLVQAGVHPITLGPLVLRCDTAAICGLALAAHHLRTMQ
jgi:16S rRNA (uracil1498-N3)-methyltransferase